MDTPEGAQKCRSHHDSQASSKRDRKPAAAAVAGRTEKTLPAPLDLSSHFSTTTKNRDASNIKKFYKYFTIPGINNTAGGQPHAAYFPFDTLEGKVALPNRFKPTPNEPDPEGDQEYDTLDDVPLTTPPSNRLIVPKESDNTNIRKKIDLTTALQYGFADGYPPLLSFLRQFTRRHLHPNVPYAGGPEVILTCGNTDGFAKSIEAFTNPWNEERDWEREREGILCESFTYPNAIQTAAPRGLNVVPVRMDEEGMTTLEKGGLADVLDNWDFSRGKRPHLMYTVTIGQNPTGAVLSVERRKHIYALCQKYNIIIIEDDPYWHLQYPSATRLAAQYKGSNHSERDLPNYNGGGKSSGFKFLDALVPSYLSMDTDGRVVRLDTFSKSIAPGCRLGWLTAQPPIVERILRITETTTQQPSGFAQSMVAELIIGKQGKDSPASEDPLSKTRIGWKVDGWVRWLEGIRGDYERRMRAMCTVLEENKFILRETVEQKKRQQRPSRRPFGLGSGSNDSIDGEWEVVHKIQMFDFSWPRGGMFVWLHVLLDTHPLHDVVEEKKLARGLWKHLTTKPYLCLVAPGEMFSPTKETMEETSAWSYFRISFVQVDSSDVADVSHLLVDAFKSFWQKTSPGEIDDPEDDDDDGY